MTEYLMAPPPTGREIRQARIDRGMSIAELARAAGVTWRTVHNVEMGHHTPHGATIRQIVSALNAVEPLPAIKGRVAGDNDVSPEKK